MVAPQFSVVIVGGGFSGTSALSHLSERFDSEMRAGRVQVSLIERTDEPGTGLAWSGAMASDCQLCNLPVRALSLSQSSHPTFEEWLRQAHGARFGADECLAAAYPPRRYFGEYLQAMLLRLTAGPGANLRTGTEVVGIVPQRASRYRLRLSRGADLEADFVILCKGAATTGSSHAFAGLAGRPGYVETPWPAAGLAHAVRHATGVAILGTGLTAIDAVKHLHATHPGTPTVMTSRHGRFNVVARDLRLPAVADQPPYECVVLTPKAVASLPTQCSLEDCVELVKREIEACLGDGAVDWQDLLRPELDGVAEWRRHVAAHRAGRLCRWQLALSAIEVEWPQLWRRLSDADRARWMASSMRTMFQNYANPLPIESAEEVLSLIDAGDVAVRGGLQSVEPLDGGGFRLRYLTNSHLTVSHCVNCTGVGFDVAEDRSPLMQQLLADRMLRPHRFGGVVVDPETFCTGDGGIGLYVVGHDARGVRYLTSGIGFLHAMIRAVVQDIARRTE